MNTETRPAGELTRRSSGLAQGARPGPRGDERKDEGGFGLVEALIAFVLLSVGMLAIAGIALSTAAQTRAASDVTQQALASQQAMEVWLTTPYSEVPAGTKDTTVSLAGRDFTVTREVSAIGPRAKEIVVSVGGEGREDQRTLVSRLRARRTP